MKETELRAIPAFATLSVLREDEANGLTRPNDPAFSGVIREAASVSEVNDFLRDPKLVAKGAYRDEFGNVFAIFWEKR